MKLSEITIINGKPALVFDQMPALIFVSNDGYGAYDQLFINGKEDEAVRSLTIESEVDSLTTYKTDKYAAINGQERG